MSSGSTENRAGGALCAHRQGAGAVGSGGPVRGWGSCLAGLLLKSQMVEMWRNLGEVTPFPGFLLPTPLIASLQHPQPSHPQSARQQRAAAAGGHCFQRMLCLAVPPPCGQPGTWPWAPRHWGASGNTGRAKGILSHRAGAQPGPLQGPKVPHEQLPAVTLLLSGPQEQGCRPAPESKPIVHWQPS